MLAGLRRVVVVLLLCLAAFAPVASGAALAGAATQPDAAEAGAAPTAAEDTGSEPQAEAGAEVPAQPAAGEAAREAAPPDLEALLQPVARAAAAVDAVEGRLEEIKGSDEQLAEERASLGRLQEEAQKQSDALKPRLEALRSQIEKLGAAPGKGGQPEPAEIAAERKRLGGLQSRIDAAIKTADLTQVRAAQLMQRVRSLRQSAFARELFRRTVRHPLSAGGLEDLRAELGDAGRKIEAASLAWWAAARGQLGRLLVVLALALGAYVVARRYHRRFVYKRVVQSALEAPSFAARAATATVLFVTKASPALLALAIVHLGLDMNDLLYRESGRIIKSAILAAVLAALVMAAARAVLQPRHGAWRLLDLSDASARRVQWLIGALAIVYGLDRVADDAIRELSLALPVSVASAFAGSLATAALLALLATVRLEPRSADAGAPGLVSWWQPRWLKLPLLALAAAIAGATLLGYVALGQFLATQTVLTGATLALIGLVHLGVGALTASEGEGGLLQGPVGAMLGLDEARGRQMMNILRLLLGALLVLAAVPLLMLSLGVPTDEVAGYVRSGLFGFEIGHFRVSLARILIAAAIFLGAAFATRLLQRWLATNVLAAGKVDSGIANSIETGVGYAGMGLAALVAVSYAGFDITNVAIVAGALSVGIGFGLQSIVNNFVSGLIVLVERPVKVGDWIVVKGFEGYVRRISVRATEIETFDRASVIVPNSELISGAVTNWTLRNALGRITVKVRVSYKADPDQVLAVLGEVAKANALILQYPEPLITLDNLANEGLDFSVRVLVADINKSLKAQTALRAEIVKAFREAGIEIPHLALVSYLGQAAAPSAVTVKVRTSLRADPERTAAVLAHANRGVQGLAQDAAPTVALDSIGEDGLEFSVKAALGEGSVPAAAESALRMAIVGALNRAGIEIAVGQRDIHLRDLDAVRGFLARAAEERMRKAAAGPGGVPAAKDPERGA